jgi:hypothetical protein
MEYPFATVSMKKYGIKQLFYCKAFFLLPPNKTAAASKSTYPKKYYVCLPMNN